MKLLLLLILLELNYAFPYELRLGDDEVSEYFGLSDEAPDYQIVYIEHVSSTTIRHVTRDSIAERLPSFKFRAFGEDFHIDATRDNNLFTEQTANCRYLDDTGTVTIEEIPTDCFYRGSLRGDTKSIVSINTCAGITGSITRHGQGDLYIEPLKNAHATKRGMQMELGHVVYKAPEKQPFECGVIEEAGNVELHTDDTVGATAESEKYLKLHMVADHQYWDFRGSESCKCLTATFHGVAHRMALLPHLNLLLDGITIIKTNTLLDTDMVSSDNLNKIRDWVALQPEQADWDHVALIVPRYMDVGGRAWLCGTCGTNKVSVNYAASLYGVQVVAHEMGHNLCIDHDNGSAGCVGAGFVMDGAGYANYEMGWTQCSIDTYNRKIKTFSCLNDI